MNAPALHERDAVSLQPESSPVDAAVSSSGESLQPLPVLPVTTSRLASRWRRAAGMFTGGMFLRYLAIGLLNTLVGYCSYVVALGLLGRVIAARYQYLAAPLASVLSTPANITFAYFGYKFFVFKTRGNYLMEWLKCFAVYGTGMLPGLFALGALTRLFQGLIHSHAAGLHHLVAVMEAHLSGGARHVVEHAAASRNIAGYLAGAIVMGLTTIYSFVGHRKVTFKAAGSKVSAA